MRPLAIGIICAALTLGNLSCSVNILGTFANQKTNQALYYNAQILVNQGDYNGALAQIAQMTGTYPTTTPVLELQASAYGGLCGLQFLPFAQAMGNMGASLLFPFLLKTFDAGISGNIDNCTTAENIMLSIGPIVSRSADDNFFIATLAFAQIGNILSFYADPTHTGTATAGFDPCAVGGARPANGVGGPITDADARQLGVSLSLAIANLTAVAGQVNLGSGSLAAISGVCTALPAPLNFCGVTTPAGFTANEVLGIRSLVNESTVVGLGSNCTGNVVACACP